MPSQGTAAARAADTFAHQAEAYIGRSLEPLSEARKAICALVFFASDLVALSLGLQFVIVTQAAVFPRFGLRTSPITFGLRHYSGLGWALLVIPLFYAVEGLYTQRRTMWKEI